MPKLLVQPPTETGKVEFFADPKKMADMIYNYIMDNPKAFPGDVRAWIQKFMAPTVSLTYGVAETGEVLYARYPDLKQKELEFAATVAGTAAYQELNNFADDDGKRGEGIYKALLREAGVPPPPGEEWPMPKDIYLPPPPLNEKDVGTRGPDIPPPEPGTGSTPTPDSEPLELNERAEEE